MVSSKAGLLVQRPTRGSPFQQIKLCTNLSDCSLSSLSTQGNISGEFCLSSSLQWAWIQQNSGRSLQIPWKKYFQVDFWYCISASATITISQNQQPHWSALCFITLQYRLLIIAKDCAWVDECFSYTTITKWSKIQVCQKKTKKFQLRARCPTTWEQDAVQTTRRPWKGQNSKNILPWLWICKCPLYIVIYE